MTVEELVEQGASSDQRVTVAGVIVKPPESYQGYGMLEIATSESSDVRLTVLASNLRPLKTWYGGGVGSLDELTGRFVMVSGNYLDYFLAADLVIPWVDGRYQMPSEAKANQDAAHLTSASSRRGKR